MSQQATYQNYFLSNLKRTCPSDSRHSFFQKRTALVKPLLSLRMVQKSNSTRVPNETPLQILEIGPSFLPATLPLDQAALQQQNVFDYTAWESDSRRDFLKIWDASPNYYPRKPKVFNTNSYQFKTSRYNDAFDSNKLADYDVLICLNMAPDLINQATKLLAALALRTTCLFTFANQDECNRFLSAIQRVEEQFGKYVYYICFQSCCDLFQYVHEDVTYQNKFIFDHYALYLCLSSSSSKTSLSQLNQNPPKTYTFYKANKTNQKATNLPVFPQEVIDQKELKLSKENLEKAFKCALFLFVFTSLIDLLIVTKS